MKKLSLSIARKLLQLMSGDTLPNSSLKGELLDDLLAENIIARKGSINKTISINNIKALGDYLFRNYEIADLCKYIDTLSKEDKTRADLVKVAGNSKIEKVRSFKGFLVNCYEPINARINDIDIVIRPQEGLFTFVYDFEDFSIPKDIVIVGIENPENFRHIHKQKYLFENMKCLFVSRYPQNQSKDFREWLNIIPNSYLHFGDFDFAGLGIYYNEYKKYLGNKSNILVPNNLELLISNYGNRELYNKQTINFDETDAQLSAIVSLIRKYGKGLEQEVFISQTSPSSKY